MAADVKTVEETINQGKDKMNEIEIVTAVMVFYTWLGWTIRGAYEYRKRYPIKFKK